MSKSFLSPVARITLGLVSLTTSIILLGTFFGLFPDVRGEIVRHREELCESISMSFSTIANRVDVQMMEAHFRKFKDRYPEIKSIGLCHSDGSPIVEAGDHFANWKRDPGKPSTPHEISLPVYAYGEKWGYLEFRFDEIPSGWIGFLSRTEMTLAIFVSIVGSLTFYAYLRFVLRQLNPQKVVPRRVRDALDTLAEGLVILDKSQRIVLANKAFLRVTGQTEKEVLGEKISSLKFEGVEEHEGVQPWDTALKEEQTANNLLMKIGSGEAEVTFSVSCAPIFDNNGVSHGAIVSFEDVTSLQKKTQLLKEMLQELDESTAEIKRQNEELEFLATRDPLTTVRNRRSFFELFNRLFSRAKNEERELSGFMVDIDHFKSINDNHGHGVGDEVLKAVAKCLETSTRLDDIVCRYGGEEFSVLLPDTTIEEAAKVAENVRLELERLNPAGLDITASLGVSSMAQNPGTPQDLLEHADKCLYVAKRNGRNQVVRYDQVPEDLVVDESSISRTKEEESYDNDIPFHAVTALISALAYRDQETASHSRRVADLCVAAAEGLLPMKECYLLEVAGLLHDIGKIGVPDTILLKKEKLGPEEWKAIQNAKRTGVELINTTFGCSELVAIVEGSYLTDTCRREKDINISIGARILKIADAFDAMTNYRAGMSPRNAFEELRKNSGTQFDPELVERFIQIIKIRGDELLNNSLEVSKEAALSIGLQIERLSIAIDNRDKDGITAIATRLQETARKHGADEFAQKALEITEELKVEADLYEVVRATNELIDLCRVTQRTLLHVNEKQPSVKT